MEERKILTHGKIKVQNSLEEKKITHNIEKSLSKISDRGESALIRHYLDDSHKSPTYSSRKAVKVNNQCDVSSQKDASKIALETSVIKNRAVNNRHPYSKEYRRMVNRSMNTEDEINYFSDSSASTETSRLTRRMHDDGKHREPKFSPTNGPVQSPVSKCYIDCRNSWQTHQLHRTHDEIKPHEVSQTLLAGLGCGSPHFSCYSEHIGHSTMHQKSLENHSKTNRTVELLNSRIKCVNTAIQQPSSDHFSRASSYYVLRGAAEELNSKIKSGPKHRRSLSPSPRTKNSYCQGRTTKQAPEETSEANPTEDSTANISNNYVSKRERWEHKRAFWRWKRRHRGNDSATSPGKQALSMYQEDIRNIDAQMENMPDSTLDHSLSSGWFNQLQLRESRYPWIREDMDGVDSNAKNGHLTRLLSIHDQPKNKIHYTDCEFFSKTCQCNPRWKQNSSNTVPESPESGNASPATVLQWEIPRHSQSNDEQVKEDKIYPRKRSYKDSRGQNYKKITGKQRVTNITGGETASSNIESVNSDHQNLAAHIAKTQGGEDTTDTSLAFDSESTFNKVTNSIKEDITVPVSIPDHLVTRKTKAADSVRSNDEAGVRKAQGKHLARTREGDDVSVSRQNIGNDEDSGKLTAEQRREAAREASRRQVQEVKRIVHMKMREKREKVRRKHKGPNKRRKSRSTQNLYSERYDVMDCNEGGRSGEVTDGRSLDLYYPELSDDRTDEVRENTAAPESLQSLELAYHKYKDGLDKLDAAVEDQEYIVNVKQKDIVKGKSALLGGDKNNKTVVPNAKREEQLESENDATFKAESNGEACSSSENIRTDSIGKVKKNNGKRRRRKVKKIMIVKPTIIKNCGASHTSLVSICSKRDVDIVKKRQENRAGKDRSGSDTSLSSDVSKTDTKTNRKKRKRRRNKNKERKDEGKWNPSILLKQVSESKGTNNYNDSGVSKTAKPDECQILSTTNCIDCQLESPANPNDSNLQSSVKTESQLLSNSYLKDSEIPSNEECEVFHPLPSSYLFHLVEPDNQATPHEPRGLDTPRNEEPPSTKPSVLQGGDALGGYRPNSHKTVDSLLKNVAYPYHYNEEQTNIPRYECRAYHTRSDTTDMNLKAHNLSEENGHTVQNVFKEIPCITSFNNETQSDFHEGYGIKSNLGEKNDTPNELAMGSSLSALLQVIDNAKIQLEDSRSTLLDIKISADILDSDDSKGKPATVTASNRLDKRAIPTEENIMCKSFPVSKSRRKIIKNIGHSVTPDLDCDGNPQNKLCDRFPEALHPQRTRPSIDTFHTYENGNETSWPVRETPNPCKSDATYCYRGSSTNTSTETPVFRGSDETTNLSCSGFIKNCYRQYVYKRNLKQCQRTKSQTHQNYRERVSLNHSHRSLSRPIPPVTSLCGKLKYGNTSSHHMTTCCAENDVSLEGNSDVGENVKTCEDSDDSKKTSKEPLSSRNHPDTQHQQPPPYSSKRRLSISAKINHDRSRGLLAFLCRTSSGEGDAAKTGEVFEQSGKGLKELVLEAAKCNFPDRPAKKKSLVEEAIYDNEKSYEENNKEECEDENALFVNRLCRDDGQSRKIDMVQKKDGVWNNESNTGFHVETCCGTCTSLIPKSFAHQECFTDAEGSTRSRMHAIHIMHELGPRRFSSHSVFDDESDYNFCPCSDIDCDEFDAGRQLALNIKGRSIGGDCAFDRKNCKEAVSDHDFAYNASKILYGSEDQRFDVPVHEKMHEYDSRFGDKNNEYESVSGSDSPESSDDDGDEEEEDGDEEGESDNSEMEEEEEKEEREDESDDDKEQEISVDNSSAVRDFINTNYDNDHLKEEEAKHIGDKGVDDDADNKTKDDGNKNRIYSSDKETYDGDAEDDDEDDSDDQESSGCEYDDDDDDDDESRSDDDDDDDDDDDGTISGDVDTNDDNQHKEEEDINSDNNVDNDNTSYADSVTEDDSSDQENALGENGVDEVSYDEIVYEKVELNDDDEDDDDDDDDDGDDDDDDDDNDDDDDDDDDDGDDADDDGVDGGNEINVDDDDKNSNED